MHLNIVCVIIHFSPSLYKTCQNTGFLLPVFSRTKTGSMEKYGSVKTRILTYFMQCTVHVCLFVFRYTPKVRWFILGISGANLSIYKAKCGQDINDIWKLDTIPIRKMAKISNKKVQLMENQNAINQYVINQYDIRKYIKIV